MSVVQSIKSALGMTDAHDTYRCEACGETFESVFDQGDFLLECEACGSNDVTEVDG